MDLVTVLDRTDEPFVKGYRAGTLFAVTQLRDYIKTYQSLATVMGPGEHRSNMEFCVAVLTSAATRIEQSTIELTTPAARAVEMIRT